MFSRATRLLLLATTLAAFLLFISAVNAASAGYISDGNFESGSLAGFVGYHSTLSTMTRRAHR
jgi:hypothetical protein